VEVAFEKPPAARPWQRQVAARSQENSVTTITCMRPK
jgi:hypothetical protein